VALARALFRQGASFTAAMVFEIASTNLVVELGVILALLIGWQFTLAEFVGGPLMIVLVAVCSGCSCAGGSSIAGPRPRARPGAYAGAMEGHAAMDMSVRTEERKPVASLRGRRRRLTSVSHIFIMEWAAVIRDIAVGLLVAGAVAAWVPDLLAALLLRGPSPCCPRSGDR
jgi:uncharacterized membrane protein YraQ (UPF0718 family)